MNSNLVDEKLSHKVNTANVNLFGKLAEAFPSELGACAIETDSGLLYSWQDLLDATAMMANMLCSLNLRPGARVVAQVEKSVEALILYLATLRAGLVFIPLNTAYQIAEIAYFIGDAQPAVLVCSEHNFGWLYKIAISTGTVHIFTLNDDRTGSLLDRTAQFPPHHSVAQRSADDLAAIIYTSGTTGRSKGAMLSHGNLLSNALVLNEYWDWRQLPSRSNVLIHALPIFHVHGLFVAIHSALISGSKMIWLAKFDTKTVLRFLPSATVFMGVPTYYMRLLSEPDLTPKLVCDMRLFISGSAPMTLETFKDWKQRTGHFILERYGMSETIMIASNPCRLQDGKRKGGTVGKVLPGVKLRLHGDDEKPVPKGVPGRIEVAGPNVFLGYWNMPEKTAHEFTVDGFFKTGDLGQMDDQGYLTIVGRSKDLIISGGYNVYPAEIEGYINTIPGVAESAVVGIPDADFGEVGVAVVTAKPGIQLDPGDIIKHLKDMLANFKIPKQCYVVQELPRNAMGKVQKNLLRDKYH